MRISGMPVRGRQPVSDSREMADQRQPGKQPADRDHDRADHVKHGKAEFTAFVHEHTGQDFTALIDAWLDSPTTPAL